MEWIKSSEREPLNEGVYHCKHNGTPVVLNFVKMQPKKEHFVINENYCDDLLKETKYWTKDINSSLFTKSNSDLLWLDEK